MSSQFDIYIYLPFLLIGLLLVIGVIGAYVSYTARNRAWADLAERTGLTFDPGGFLGAGRFVSGVYQRHQIKLDSFTRHSGKHSTSYTRIVLILNQATSIHLKMYQENMFTRLGKSMGMKEVQLGDDEIDRKFVIQGEPESDVLRALTALGMRQRLLEAPYLNLEVKNGQIYYEKRGYETDANTLIAVLDLLSALADAIERL